MQKLISCLGFLFIIVSCLCWLKVSARFTIPQALSISRALFRAQVQAEKGQVNCSELIKTAILFMQEAGGKVDYAEVRT